MPRRRATTPPGAPPNGAAAPGSAWTPRDMLVPHVLLAVSLQRAHGYLIEEYLKSLGFLGVEMSTLYRTLRQMERDGLLFSAWEPGPTGPARRVYSLTDAGRTWLDSWAAALDAYRGMIDRFFGLYTGAWSGPGTTPAAPQPQAEPRPRTRTRARGDGAAPATPARRRKEPSA